MDNLTVKQIEDEIILRYWDGVNHGRYVGEAQKRCDWDYCQEYFEELDKRKVPLGQYLQAIQTRINSP